MKRQLTSSEIEQVTAGSFTREPKGTFWRRTSRTKRKQCDALIQLGTPILVFSPWQQIAFYADMPDSSAVWREYRPSVTSDLRNKLNAPETPFTAGIWVDFATGEEMLCLSGHD